MSWYFVRVAYLHGVVPIRLPGLAPNRKAQIVSVTVKEHASELSKAFAVVTAGATRMRQYDK